VAVRTLLALDLVNSWDSTLPQLRGLTGAMQYLGPDATGVSDLGYNANTEGTQKRVVFVYRDDVYAIELTSGGSIGPGTLDAALQPPSSSTLLQYWSQFGPAVQASPPQVVYRGSGGNATVAKSTATTGNYTLMFSFTPVGSIAVSPDGAFLAIGGDARRGGPRSCTVSEYRLPGPVFLPPLGKKSQVFAASLPSRFSPWLYGLRWPWNPSRSKRSVIERPCDCKRDQVSLV